MPTWSPDDREIAFASTRESSQSIWAVSVADLGAAQAGHGQGARLDAPSWSRGGQVVYHVTAAARAATRWTARQYRHRERVRLSLVVGLAHRVRLRLRRADSPPHASAPPAAQTVAFSATLQVTQPQYTRRVRDFTSTAPRKALGIVRPVHLARRQPDRVRRRRRHLRRAVGRRQAGQPDQRLGARHRSVVVARRRQPRLLVGQERARCCSCGSAT